MQGVKCGHCVRLHDGARLLSDSYLLRPGCCLIASHALRGGKGGYGSTLRAMGRKHMSDNTSDCRDLQGRRMRDVEAAQQAAEWAASQKERDESKEAEKKAREEERKQRLEEGAQVSIWQHQLLDSIVRSYPDVSVLCGSAQLYNSCAYNNDCAQAIQAEVEQAAKIDPARIESSVLLGRERAAAQPEKRPDTKPGKRSRMFQGDEESDLESSSSDEDGPSTSQPRKRKAQQVQHVPQAVKTGAANAQRGSSDEDLTRTALNGAA
jgi:Silencing defective 2 N-terminal ubiquitin domain